MNTALDPDAQSALDEYLGVLDALLPSAWLDLTGSAVPGDWLPARSDLVTMIASPA